MDIEVRSVEELLQSFMSAYNQKIHIPYILKHQDIIVCFQMEAGSYFVVFHNGTAFLSEGSGHPPTIVLSGSYENIKEILCGKRNLRQSAANNDLLIRANFRSILLLESIFYLTSRGGKCN